MMRPVTQRQAFNSPGPEALILFTLANADYCTLFNPRGISSWFALAFLSVVVMIILRGLKINLLLRRHLLLHIRESSDN